MSFDTINQVMVAESGRIGTDIYRRSLLKSPWNALVKRDRFPEEMGSTIQVLTYERSLPATDTAWATVALGGVGSASTNCVPSADIITPAQTLRNYSLEMKALESNRICVEDLRFPLRRQEQLSAVYDMLTQNTAWAWKKRFQLDFTSIAMHKIAIGSSSYEDQLQTGTSDFPLIYGGKLTNSILEELHLQLCRDGADENGSYARVDGVPVYPLIIGAETSRALLRESEYRTDVRENNAMVPELLKPLGVRVSMLGYMHTVDLLPRRFNFTNGAWVEVQPYAVGSEGEAATYGSGYVISQDYKDAVYEDAYIFHPDVFHSMVPAPITSPGGNTKFNPVEYSGKWGWRNYLSDDNPDGTLGYFRGILAHGAKPIKPQFGYVIRHKRCQGPTFATC